MFSESSEEIADMDEVLDEDEGAPNDPAIDYFEFDGINQDLKDPKKCKSATKKSKSSIPVAKINTAPINSGQTVNKSNVPVPNKKTNSLKSKNEKAQQAENPILLLIGKPLIALLLTPPDQKVKKDARARNRHGGGIAILIFCRTSFLYNPPNIELPFELFLDISRKCGKFLIGGDLNAKTKSLGCFSENENGIILEKIINKLNLSSDYYEILDIFLIPSSLSDRVVDFKVLIDHNMLTNWHLYQDLLMSSSHNNYNTENIDELNERISKNIINAAQKRKIFGDLLAATFSPHLYFDESEDNCEISHENWQDVV
ncbi:hypothetical protein BpHYR1_037827 [Brachionus plicatilis]|uniref:RNA-directed DNA polymerase from mobile element jockey-like n=1 Tax=Brachionus plicatilis TaxID=10195 RepID=A0A3M7QXU4_BRAPC|nr:hypothetical protein BpHYR1_037827 [Brachionus plicatilis]